MLVINHAQTCLYSQTDILNPVNPPHNFIAEHKRNYSFLLFWLKKIQFQNKTKTKLEPN